MSASSAVSYSDDGSGTTCGGWLLRYRDGTPPGASTAMPPLALPGLETYRTRWLEQLVATP
jgi:L-fuculokinase